MPISKIKTSSILADAASTNLNIDAGTLFLDTTNNFVGVGTTSPTTKIQITRNALSGFVSRTSAAITLEDTAGTELYFASNTAGYGQLRFGDTDSNFRGALTYDHSVDAMYLYTAGTERMRIDSSGNVGVGTVSPASTLDVVASGVTTSTIRSTSTTGSREAKLRLNVPSAGGDDPAGQIEFTYGTGYTVAGSIQMTHTNPNMKFFTGTTERVRIDANGNVGIGTTTIGTKLVVAGTGQSLVGTAFNVADFTNSGQTLGTRIGYDSSNGAVIASSGVDKPIAFWQYNTSNYLERMRINSAGDLVLGTATSLSTSAGRTDFTINGSSNSIISFGVGGTRQGYLYAPSTGMILTAETGILNLQTTAAHAIYLTTNGSERMRVSSTGYVGINTSTPGTNGAFEIRRGVTTGAMLNCSFSTSDAANSTFDIGHPAANVVGLSAQGSNIAFYGGGNVGNAERMRLDRTSGQLLINDTTDAAGSGARLHITGNSSQSACSIKIGTNGYPGWYFVNISGTKVGDIVINSGSTTYNTTSDYRLKNTIAPMTGALAKVAQLKPVTYKWNTDGSSSQGFIAHELQAVIPDCVTGEKDAVDADDKPIYQGIDTSFLVATLTAAIQELKAIVDAQAVEIAALKVK